MESPTLTRHIYTEISYHYIFLISFLQGHSRRILVRVRPVANSGTLPLILESVTSLSVGCVCVRSRLQKGLDSYQEEDLTVLRDHWSKALARRKNYLDEQIQKLINKQGGYVRNVFIESPYRNTCVRFGTRWYKFRTF